MAKGYWIGRVDVHNEEGYKPYAAANGPIFKKWGARFVVRAGKFTGVEGNVARDLGDHGCKIRNVVVPFDQGRDQTAPRQRAPVICRAQHHHTVLGITTTAIEHREALDLPLA